MNDEQLLKLKQAAAAGNREAMNDYGAVFYNRGEYEKAKEWYEKAAAAGCAWSWCNLGYIYGLGRLGVRDDEKAFYCYTKAALMGNVNAQYKLGDCYYYGDFVKQDDETAFMYYEKAYENCWGEDDDLSGDVAYRLALCYHLGRGVHQDDYAALRYINEAQTAVYCGIRDNKPNVASLARRVEWLRPQILAALDEQS